MSGSVLRKPEERTCERCGRQEVWDETRRKWRVVEDEEPRTGNVYCLHEWDINGAFVPVDNGYR